MNKNAHLEDLIVEDLNSEEQATIAGGYGSQQSGYNSGYGYQQPYSSYPHHYGHQSPSSGD